MNIHELYNIKKEEYQEFVVASNFYNKQLTESLDKLSVQIKELQDAIKQADCSIIPDKLPEVLSSLESDSTLAEHPETIKERLTKLNDCQLELEQKIEAILNDNV